MLCTIPTRKLWRRAAWMVSLLTLCVGVSTLAADLDRVQQADLNLRAAQNAVDIASVREAEARDAFIKAKERLGREPAQAPRKRRNKVKRDLLNEAIDANTAWDRAKDAHEAARADLERARAEREAARATAGDEGRRLASRSRDGERALDKGYSALVSCDEAAFEVARRRLASALAGVAGYADEWLLAPSSTSAQREWGAAAHHELNRLASEWKALEAEWEAKCRKGLVCESGTALLANASGPDERPAIGGAGSAGARGAAPAGSGLAQDLACPGIERGRTQQEWLEAADVRAEAQFGSNNDAFFTQVDRDERVVLFTLHRSRLYDLAGQIAYLNQFVDGGGSVVPGGLIDAADNGTLPAFVESFLTGEVPATAFQFYGQRPSPKLDAAQERLRDELAHSINVYNGVVRARANAQTLYDDASATLAALDPPDSLSLIGTEAGVKRAKILNQGVAEAEQALAEMQAAQVAQQQARAELDAADAALKDANERLDRHPLLGERLDGRRLIDILQDSEVDDAARERDVDLAVRRYIDKLIEEFQRVATLASYQELAEELLHPSLAPLHAYTASVLQQFCLGDRGARIIANLTQTYLQDVRSDELDEKTEDIVFMAVGTGLLLVLSGGTVAFVALGAEAGTLATFVAVVGSADVAAGAAEFAVADARLDAATTALGRRNQQSVLGALTDPAAVAAERQRFQAASSGKTLAGVGVVLSVAGEVVDVTEASVRVYRMLGGADEVAEAAGISVDAAADIIFQPGGLRTVRALDNLPAGMAPAVGEIGQLPDAVEAALRSRNFKALEGVEITIAGTTYTVAKGAGAGSFGVVLVTTDGKAIRFASTSSGNVKKAFDAAYGALDGMGALANAGIDDVRVPQLFAVGTQGGKPRVFVSELIPEDLLQMTSEDLIDVMNRLSNGGVVWLDAAERNGFKSGIVDPDFLGAPTLDGTRLAERAEIIVFATDLLNTKLFKVVEQGARESAFMNAHFTNLALLGSRGVFKIDDVVVDGELRFVIEPGSASLEYLARKFPYFADLRKAIEGLAPGQKLSAVPAAPIATGARAGALTGAPVQGVAHLLPVSGASAAAAGIGGLGRLVNDPFQPAGGAGAGAMGPFTFMTTSAPLCWTSLGVPVPIPEEVGGGYVVPFRSYEVEQVLQGMRGLPGVNHVELDPPRRPEANAGDALYRDQWGLKRIGVDSDVVDSSGVRYAPVIVAVLDTGLDREHPDLDATRLWRNPGEIPNGFDDDHNGYVDDVAGWDFVDGDPDPGDTLGHGTHVAGVIAAADQGISVAPMVRIMPLRVLGGAGRGYASRVAEAIFYAVRHRASVINLSVGGEALSATERLAIDYARARDVIVVTAAGNAGVDTAGYGPAGVASAITVAATGHDDEPMAFSNWGAAVKIAAPGVDVLSLRAAGTDFNLALGVDGYRAGAGFVGFDARYYVASGTSFAAPFVAGAAALLRSVNPTLSSTDVERMLLMSADDVGVPGWDRFTGVGRLNVARALVADPDAYLEVRVDDVQPADKQGSPVIAVEGSVKGNELAGWTLELGRGERPTTWRTITKGVSPIGPGRLGAVPVALITARGAWTIRVIAQDRAGNRREARGSVTVN